MLFEISEDRKSNIDSYKIVGNQHTVIYYDMPMLFTGKNSKGHNIIGMVSCEHPEDDIIRYLLIAPTQIQFEKFIHGGLDLLSVINQQQEIAILDDCTPNPEITYLVRHKDIPEDYLPKSGLLYSTIESNANGVSDCLITA